MSKTDQSIAAQVGDLNAGLATQLPTEVLHAFGAEQAGIDAAGLPAGIPTAGTPMPDGELLDAHGNASLTQTRDGHAAVVVNYRGAWCPYCTLTLKAYEEQLVSKLKAQGVKLIAVSPQEPDGSLTMKQTNELTFDVVSDPGNQIAKALGILTEPTDQVKGAQSALGVDLPSSNSDGTHGIPMPTVTVVDTAGVIRWIDVHPNYTTRSEPQDILIAVAALKNWP